LFPLRDSYFEGIPVKIPFEYRSLLEAEYGKKSLTVTQFSKYVPSSRSLCHISATDFANVVDSHRFNPETKIWVPLPKEPASKEPAPKKPAR
jgi:hypothetical protein